MKRSLISCVFSVWLCVFQTDSSKGHDMGQRKLQRLYRLSIWRISDVQIQRTQEGPGQQDERGIGQSLQADRGQPLRHG